MRSALLMLVCIGVGSAGVRAGDAASSKNRQIIIRVLDDQGRPISGAEVFRNHVYAIEGQKQAEIENEIYLTNDDGKATVKLSEGSVDLRLWASKPGFVSYHAMWAKQFQPDNHQIPEKFTFRLPPGSRIGGVVTNERGDPIKNAKVDVVDKSAMGNRGYAGSVARRPIRAYSLTSELLTDDHGRWEIQNAPNDNLLGDLEESHFVITISHRDYETRKFQDQNTSDTESTTAVSLKNLRARSAVMELNKTKKKD